MSNQANRFSHAGHANGRNPISVIVPCHRVIGADGKLTGSAGGLDKKQWLLAWEGRETAAAAGYLFDVAGIAPTRDYSMHKETSSTIGAGRTHCRSSHA